MGEKLWSTFLFESCYTEEQIGKHIKFEACYTQKLQPNLSFCPKKNIFDLLKGIDSIVAETRLTEWRRKGENNCFKIINNLS